VWIVGTFEINVERFSCSFGCGWDTVYSHAGGGFGPLSLLFLDVPLREPLPTQYGDRVSVHVSASPCLSDAPECIGYISVQAHDV
jgi:hypothetical protein